MPITHSTRFSTRGSKSTIYDPYAHLVAFDGSFSIGTGSVLVDGSTYNSHGAITTASWAAGLHTACLDFNSATPDYVTIPAAYDQLDFTSEAFSIVARIYVDSLTVHRTILSRHVDSASGYWFFILSTGLVYLRTSNLAGNQNTLGTVGGVLINTWYTVGMSRVGASVRVYRNGVDTTSSPGVHVDPVTNAGNAIIGVRNDLATNPFDGKIEFCRVFGGVALSATEHLRYHNNLK